MAQDVSRARPGPLAIWMREARLPFVTASTVPVIVGAAVAWYERGLWSAGLFAATLLGAVLAHVGANMANDYYDARSGNDTVNPYRSPFNGGAGLIQEGLLTPSQVHAAALLCLAAAAGFGVCLWSAAGPAVAVLMALGGVLGYFYTADPLHLAYYGVGEMSVGLAFGPLLVAGAYYVQTGTVSLAAISASAPVGLLIAAVLYVNQFPDYEADKSVGKAHWVVRLGTRRAVPGLGALLFGAHLWVVAGVLLGVLPWPTLACLATLPLAWKAFSHARVFHASPVELRPANATVIGVHLLTGLLLAAGFLAAAIGGIAPLVAGLGGIGLPAAGLGG